MTVQRAKIKKPYVIIQKNNHTTNTYITMKIDEPEKITLGLFALRHGIKLAKDAVKSSPGRAIPTRQISLPPYYWVHENTYEKIK